MVGTVGAAKTLDGGIGAPTRLQQIMDPLPLVLASAISVIAAPCASRIRKHKDTLVVIHEGLRFGEVGHGGAVFDLEGGLAMGIGFAHQTAAATGYFGDLIGPEVLHDLVERARHSREACQFLDQRIATGNGFPGLNGLAIHDNGTGTKIALLIGVALVKLRREAMM